MEKIVGRKQLLWFTDGVSKRTKKEVQLSLYCNFFEGQMETEKVH